MNDAALERLSDDDRRRLGIRGSYRWLLSPEWPIPVQQVFLPDHVLPNLSMLSDDLREPLIASSLQDLQRQTAAHANLLMHPTQTIGEIAVVSAWDRLGGASLLLHRGQNPQTGFAELANMFGIPSSDGWSGATIAKIIAAGAETMPPPAYAWITHPFEIAS